MAGDIHQTEILRVKAIPCPECWAGRCRKAHRTLFTWVQTELILVQNFPAWVCDLCGWSKYDPQAVLWLRTVLNPPASRKAKKRISKLGDESGSKDVRVPHTN